MSAGGWTCVSAVGLTSVFLAGALVLFLFFFVYMAWFFLGADQQLITS